MENNFNKDYLTISVGRTRENGVSLSITSDYAYSDRKSRLYVNSKGLCSDVERIWKGRKGSKLQSIVLSFDEIDWYDDMCNVYTTPIVSIGKGSRKAKVGSQQHGSIPKEWGIELEFTFLDTKVVTPLLDAIKSTLGYTFTKDMEKVFKKRFKTFTSADEGSSRYFSLGVEEYA